MAGTELHPDSPFDPHRESNIMITLTESDLSNTITMSKELLEAKLFRYLRRQRFYRLRGLVQRNEPMLIDAFDLDTQITTTLCLEKR